MVEITEYAEELKNLVARSTTLDSNAQTGEDAWNHYLGSLGHTGTLYDKEYSWLQTNINSPVDGTKRDLWTQFLNQRGFSGDDDGLRAWLNGGGDGSTSLDYVAGNAQAYWKADQKSGDYLVDLTGNGHDARFGSVGEARVINKGRAKYLRLPGVVGNYASAPDSAALDITGDIDIRVKVSLNDWTPAAVHDIVSKYGNAAERAFIFRVDTAGTLRFFWSENGTDALSAISTVATGFTDGETKWVRVTLDVDNGASARDIKFYTSTDGVTWAQLGATVTNGVTPTSIFNSPQRLEIGSSQNNAAATVVAGKFYRVIVKNGIDGTTVFDADFTNLADGTTSFTESSSNAATVTINSTSAADTNDPTYLEYTGTKYVYTPGTTGNYASAPDSAALSITGDITMDVKVAMDDWTPGATSDLMGKYVGGGSQGGYIFRLATSGVLGLVWSTTGADSLAAFSTVATGVTDGAVKWVRTSFDVNDGAGNRVVKFYTSDDGVAWTQLGATVTAAATTSIFDSTANLEVGSAQNGASPSAGKFYRAKVYNSYLQDTAGTPVFDLDTSKATSPFATMTEDSANAATVTFNRAATGKKLAVVDRTLALFGTDDYLEIQNQDNLNFAAADSFTMVAVVRQYGTNGATAIFAKDTGLAGSLGYHLRTNAASAYIFNTHDGTNENETGVFVVYTPGVIQAPAGVRNTTADTVALYIDGVLNESETDVTTGTLANTNVLRIGAVGGGTPASYGHFELIGAAIFRKVLTPAQLTQVKTELGG